MLIIYSILLASVTLVISPTIGRLPLRTDYYRSSSNTSICLEISHYYPSGPIHVYGMYYYTRYSNLLNYETKRIQAKHTFTRIYQPCNISFIFTSFGDWFERINIEISLSLAYNAVEFSSFNYNFYKGFNSGIYKLHDKRNIFMTRVKVIHKQKNYFGDSEDLKGMDELDKKLVETKNNAICIITVNNFAVVLTTKKEFITSDLIIGLEVSTFLDDIFLSRSYEAYACYKDESYPDIPVVFITDEENANIEFKLRYAVYSSKLRKYHGHFHKENESIKVSHYSSDSVYNMENIPKRYSKVFATEVHHYNEYCQDGSRLYSYRTNNNTLYYKLREKRVKIFPHVKGITRVHRSPEDPC